jgi:P-type Ca2+ transporter type 2C
MVGGQVMIIFVGGRAFSVTKLNGAQWAYSIVLGAISIPIGIIIRLIPDELVAKLVPSRFKHQNKKPQLTVSDEENAYFEWNQAIEEIRDELAFLKRFRGGRLNNIKFKLQHPREFLPGSRSGSAPHTPNRENSISEHGSPAPPTPDSRLGARRRSRSNSAFGPAAAMAGIVAGSIAGWSPLERAHGDNGSMNPKYSSSINREELERQEGVLVHPDTKADDSLVTAGPPPALGPALNTPTVKDTSIDNTPTKTSSPPGTPE